LAGSRSLLENVMITKEESLKIAEIKSLVKDGRKDLVTPAEMQWVLDVLSRENSSPNDVKKNAQSRGFKV
jgi:hypothetical protein